MNPIGRRPYEGLLPIVYMAMANSDKSLEWCNIIYDRGSHSRYHGFRAAIFFYLGDIESAKTYLKKFHEQRPEITNLEEYKKGRTINLYGLSYCRVKSNLGRLIT